LDGADALGIMTEKLAKSGLKVCLLAGLFCGIE
jgi:hypothetical protein